MDSDISLEIIAIFILIMANGFFALSEFSIIASRKSKLRKLVDEKKKGAAIAEKLNLQPDKFLASVQVGITLFATLAGVFGGATIVGQLIGMIEKIPVTFISDAASPISVVLVTLLITIVSVVIGELVPKYLALSKTADRRPGR